MLGERDGAQSVFMELQVQSGETVKLQHTKAVVCFQFCGNSLGETHMWVCNHQLSMPVCA